MCVACNAQTKDGKVVKRTFVDKSIVEIDTINHKINEMRYSEEILEIEIQVHIPEIENASTVCQNLQKYVRIPDLDKKDTS